MKFVLFSKEQENTVQYKFNKKNLLIFGVAAGILVVGIATAAIIFSNFGYDAGKYLQIAEKGFSGAGSLVVNFDTEAFLNDLHSSGQAENVSISDVDATFTVQNNGSLCNNTESVISFSSANLKIKDYVFKIETLAEPQTVNPFENLVIEYSGASGTGTAVVNTDNCPAAVQQNVTFSISPKSDLSNGDIITVTAKANSELLKKGYILNDEMQTYAVDGLIVYPTDLSTVDCTAGNDVLQKTVKNYVESSGLFINWSYENFQTDDWYLYGVFDTQYTIKPLSTYYAYEPNNPQNNRYYAVFEATLTSKCTKVYDLPENKSMAAANNLKKDYVINGKRYFVIYCNSVCLTKNKQSIVFPYLDSNYQIDEISTFLTNKNFLSETSAKKFITADKELSVIECLPYK